MSAGTPESSIALAAAADDAPPRAPDAPSLPPAVKVEVIVPAPAPAATPRAEASLPIGAYLVVVVGTALLAVVPRFRLAAGFIETVLILIGILIVLFGMVLALWSYLRPLLRR